MVVFVTLLVLIESPRPQLSDSGQPPMMDSVRRLIPTAESVDTELSSNGFWTVRDANGKTVAFAARTLPLAKDVVGYRGPSESLILLNTDLDVLGVSLIESTDTEEHVDAVLQDEFFFDQFRSWRWGGLQEGQKVDAVSGATLTSLAIAQGVLKRIGGDRPSLVFDRPLTLEELQEWFPSASSLESTDASLGLLNDSDGDLLGRVIRTGPLSDSIVGYQGPTELLLKLTDDPEPVVEAVRIRKSFDNEPYVDYVRTEYGFWPLYLGKTVPQLAELDLVAEEVEGVSGATMTSMAVAETLVAASTKFVREQAARAEIEKASDEPLWKRWFANVRLLPIDAATITTLMLAYLASRLGWFRNKTIRRVWLILVVVVIGLWAGNLISMALVAGWSAEGVAWRLAPGLAMITAIAFLLPPLTKSNPYCNHLCPHGALQQLVKPTAKSRRKRNPPRRLSRALSFLPGILLTIAYGCLVIYPKTDLSSWEPFHAYLFQIAGWGSIAFALATLVFSAFVPMGFCRFGCPTGRLLDHLRRKATSDRIQLADGVALGLLALAWLV